MNPLRSERDVRRPVFAPEIQPVLAELAEKEARLDRELQALRARRREVQGFDAGYPDRREGDRGEVAALEPPQPSLFDEARP